MTASATGAHAGRPEGGALAFRCRKLSVELESSEGRRRILDDITLDVRDGEFVSIMGRSGSGKTTLLRVLGGLLDPEPGSTIAFHGEPVHGPPEGVVFVFQNYAASLLPWRTVERNVTLGLEGRVPNPEMRRRTAEALAMVGLVERARDYPWRLSGGMQQRLQLARALAMEACVLLTDEPFGSLDAMTKAALQDELQRLHQRTGATVTFVTHDVDEAVYLSDRVLILDGTPATIAREVPVDLPRPRDQLATKELSEFLRLRRTVYDGIVRNHG